MEVQRISEVRDTEKSALLTLHHLFPERRGTDTNRIQHDGPPLAIIRRSNSLHARAALWPNRADIEHNASREARKILRLFRLVAHNRRGFEAERDVGAECGRDV